MISITLKNEGQSGCMRGDCRAETDIQTSAKGMLGTQYRFMQKVYECVAAFSALQTIPCNATLEIRICGGEATCEGRIVVLREDGLDSARFAAASIRAAAALAAATSQASSATLFLSQTWLWK